MADLEATLEYKGKPITLTIPSGVVRRKDRAFVEQALKDAYAARYPNEAGVEPKDVAKPGARIQTPMERKGYMIPKQGLDQDNPEAPGIFRSTPKVEAPSKNIFEHLLDTGKAYVNATSPINLEAAKDFVLNPSWRGVARIPKGIGFGDSQDLISMSPEAVQQRTQEDAAPIDWDSFVGGAVLPSVVGASPKLGGGVKGAVKGAVTAPFTETTNWHGFKLPNILGTGLGGAAAGKYFGGASGIGFGAALGASVPVIMGAGKGMMEGAAGKPWVNPSIANFFRRPEPAPIPPDVSGYAQESYHSGYGKPRGYRGEAQSPDYTPTSPIQLPPAGTYQGPQALPSPAPARTIPPEVLPSSGQVHEMPEATYPTVPEPPAPAPRPQLWQDVQRQNRGTTFVPEPKVSLEDIIAQTEQQAAPVVTPKPTIKPPVKPPVKNPVQAQAQAQVQAPVVNPPKPQSAITPAAQPQPQLEPTQATPAPPAPLTSSGKLEELQQHAEMRNNAPTVFGDFSVISSTGPEGHQFWVRNFENGEMLGPFRTEAEGVAKAKAKAKAKIQTEPVKQTEAQPEPVTEEEAKTETETEPPDSPEVLAAAKKYVDNQQMSPDAALIRARYDAKRIAARDALKGPTTQPTVSEIKPDVTPRSEAAVTVTDKQLLEYVKKSPTGKTANDIQGQFGLTLDQAKARMDALKAEGQIHQKVSRYNFGAAPEKPVTTGKTGKTGKSGKKVLSPDQARMDALEAKDNTYEGLTPAEEAEWIRLGQKLGAAKTGKKLPESNKVPAKNAPVLEPKVQKRVSSLREMYDFLRGKDSLSDPQENRLVELTDLFNNSGKELADHEVAAKLKEVEFKKAPQTSGNEGKTGTGESTGQEIKPKESKNPESVESGDTPAHERMDNMLALSDPTWEPGKQVTRAHLVALKNEFGVDVGPTARHLEDLKYDVQESLMPSGYGRGRTTKGGLATEEQAAKDAALMEKRYLELVKEQRVRETRKNKK